MTEVYSADEIAIHNHEKDLWIAIHEKVYNLTSFVKEHPGGEEILLALAGGDGTECFDNVGHSEEAKLLKDKYYIGELLGIANVNESSVKQKANKEGKEPATTKDDDWQYVERKEESLNSKVALLVAAAVIVYAFIIYYLWF